MAPPAGTLRVGRYFLALVAILAVLYAIVFWPGARHTPKLGLDLEGGQQVIFTASQQGGKTPSSTAMKEAQQIMEARVNGSGVTEATVVVQGNNQLVVSIPGATNTDISKLGAAAQLTMRGLVMPIVAVTPPATPSGSTTASPTSSSGSTPTTSPPGASGSSSGSGTPAALAGLPAKAPSTPATSPSASPSAPVSPTPSGSSSGPPAAPARSGNPLAGLGFTIPTSDSAFAALPAAEQQVIQQALTTVDCTKTNQQDDKAPYYVACDSTGSIAYLLGSVIVPGTQIKSANAVAPNAAQGNTQWTVALTFKGSGDSAWAHYTGAHNVSGLGSQVQPNAQTCSASTVPCADFVAFTLDGRVISAPYNQSAINGGTTQISGQFSQSTANDLANQLKYGALPLSFTPQASQTVSPTLGSAQLKAGLLAGGIGLALVIIYSLIYYRALGLVTIASLVVSGILTYGALVMLGTQIGFTLSLAGIAGFIVAVGITADSFVVFFERLKDEVRDGRSIRVAVPRAWVRARRTILSADTVSFLAAAILYYFAAGDVKGFAFTLGLSTILDLVVVFLFTHPLVSLLSRSRAFGSARFTGLDALRGGAPIRDPEPAATGRSRGVRRGARQAVAETATATAAERAAARHGTTVALAERADQLDDEVVETDELDVGEVDDEYEDEYVEDEADDDIVETDIVESDDELVHEVEDEDFEDEVVEDETVVDAEPDIEPEPAPAPPAPRPGGGQPRTAAERAAARRARLRADKENR